MSAATPERWWHGITRVQWNALIAAQVGWMLDAMDVTLYAFALTAIQAEFRLESGAAGALVSVTLLAAAVGGSIAGVVADKIGRARTLMASILVYSVFTALIATSQNVAQLVLWRTLVGIGMGAEWTAGAVLVAETWPDAHRGKAIGLMQAGYAIGYILAAALAATVLPTLGWRWLFVMGIAPAVFVAWIRRAVPEPEIWRMRGAAADARGWRDQARAILRPPLRARALIATLMCTFLLCAYWGLFTWIPTFLAAPASRGGAGLGIVKSAGWTIPMQVGAFFGYASFGFLADRFGRRPVFLVFVLGAAAIVPVYGQLGSATLLLLLGPLLGFLGHGYFSVFGSMLAEIFPSAIRATAQGFAYNAGRAVSALAPYLIGALSDSLGVGTALAVTSLFFVAGAGLMMFLPETKGESLA